eukprot:8857239-Alexandrium_andersonii.AAC.1
MMPSPHGSVQGNRAFRDLFAIPAETSDYPHRFRLVPLRVITSIPVAAVKPSCRRLDEGDLNCHPARRPE